MTLLPKKRMALFFVLIVAISGALLFYFKHYPLVGNLNLLPNVTSTQTIYNTRTSVCLGENEVVEYQVIKNQRKAGSINAKIKNKITNGVIRQFEINSVDAGNASPLEIRRCYLYVLKEFNYDQDLRTSKIDCGQKRFCSSTIKSAAA